MLTAAAMLTAVACSLPGTGPSAGGSPQAGAGSAGDPASPGPSGMAIPAPAHTVVVMLENHSYGQVIGDAAAPFINSVARRGALFTSAHAVTHPSQPNYLDLFSGSTQGVTDDSCPHEFSAPNLASELLAAHDTFAGYSEGLPATGSRVCSAGTYARKHVPWSNFSNVPATASKPFTDFPAANYARLPTVSFVIPDLCDDMHDCSVAAGDGWVREHLGPYLSWAMTHHSLLIVAWDENDDIPGNQIPLIFAGEMVRAGHYGQFVTHDNVLATIEAAYGLPRIGRSAAAAPITGIWLS
jgi:phosphatidylinositol-3-phosphatase